MKLRLGGHTIFENVNVRSIADGFAAGRRELPGAHAALAQSMTSISTGLVATMRNSAALPLGRMVDERQGRGDDLVGRDALAAGHVDPTILERGEMAVDLRGKDALIDHPRRDRLGVAADPARSTVFPAAASWLIPALLERARRPRGRSATRPARDEARVLGGRRL